MALALGGIPALFAPSCSLVIDSSATQCSTNDDCKTFPGTTCDKGTCVGGDQCTKNSDCSSKGDYWVCRQLSPRQCVQLTSDDCLKVVGDYKDDNAVMFGLIADLSSDTGASILNGATLGVEDLNALKLPPAPGGTAQRPVVLVACSDKSDNATGVRVARHMAEDLGLQAICGAAYSGITLDIAGTVTIPDSVLLMSSSATSTLITDRKKGAPKCVAACGADQTCADQCVPLLWRTSPSDKIQSAAIAAYFKDRYESEVRTDIGGMGTPFTGALKVAVAFKGDAYGQGLKEALEQQLVFNGMNALAQLDTNYKAFNYGNPDDPATSPLKYNETVVAITAFAPDIILAFGTDEAVHEPDPMNPTGAGVFKRVEASWVGPKKPHWMFSDGGLIPSLSQEAQTAGALSRVRGTIPGTENLNFQAFVSQYSSRFANETLGSAQTFGAAGAYDIMYLFSYSVVAAQGNAITGPQIATGFARMVGGSTKVKVGKAGINQAFQILSTSGGAMDFDGASGPLDFDLHYGEAVSDIEIWCLPKPDGMGMVATGSASGVSYQGVQQKIVGALKTTCSGQ